MSYRHHAAAELRAEMARQRYTSSDLAGVLSLSQTSAHRRMTGDAGLDLDEIALIADWLGIDPLRFVAFTATQEPA